MTSWLAGSLLLLAAAPSGQDHAKALSGKRLIVKGASNECPPRNWVYQVESLTAKAARLREVWTGWNDFADSVAEYRVIPVLEDPEP